MNFRITLLALSMIVASSQMGCVALNLPSQRYHDPDDGGGLLGPWSHHGNSHLHQAPCLSDGGVMAHDGVTGCLMGESLEADPFDADVDDQGKPKPPEIPWPRYHPLPTRPVFSVKSL